jgi:CheY-like chemotaxis protein
MLDFEDYNILTAKDGVEALEIIKSRRLDLILLDIMMPGKSGMEVLTEIRSSKDSKIKNLPVVVITAKSLIDDIDAALSAGATSYIVKPFRTAAIKQKIQNILEVQEN